MTRTLSRAVTVALVAGLIALGTVGLAATRRRAG